MIKISAYIVDSYYCDQIQSLELHTVSDRLSAAAHIYIFPVKDVAFIWERRLFG